MEKYEVIIIGAGASGLMCALNTNQPTLLIEASDRVGKKILATGNGKCNISNNVIDAGCYNTPLVAEYFQKFDLQQEQPLHHHNKHQQAHQQSHKQQTQDYHTAQTQ